MLVAIQKFDGDNIIITTKCASTHCLTRDEARQLGDALICMANLADELDKITTLEGLK